MLFYTIFIFTIVLLGANYRLERVNYAAIIIQRWRLKLAILLIVCVSIFRFDVGYDYQTYYRIVQTLDIKVERFEPLSRLICYITYWVKWPPLLFIIFGLITYFFHFKTIKKFSVNLYFGILTFVAFIYTTDFGNIRQGVAVAMCFFGFKYIYSKSFIKYLFCCIIASLFHTSAILAIPIYFIYNYFNIRITIICFFILTVGFQLLILQIAKLNLYVNYLEELDAFSGGDKIKYANIAWFFMIIIIDLIHKKSKNNLPLYFIVFFGIVFPFVFGGHFGGRVSRYYLIYLCLLIPETLSRGSLLTKNIVCCALIVYFLLLIYVNANATGSMVPYQSIFFIDPQNPHFRL